MGNAAVSSARGPVADPRAFFSGDLGPKFVVQTKAGTLGLLGGEGKCLKTFMMRVEGVPVVVKVYMRSSADDGDLAYSITKLNAIWMTLNPAKFPNLLPHQMWVRSSSSRRAGAGRR